MNRFEYCQWGARAMALRGNDLPHARLTPDSVRHIRSSQMTARQLAEKFGVHVRTIEKVRRFESWSHV